MEATEYWTFHHPLSQRWSHLTWVYKTSHNNKIWQNFFTVRINLTLSEINPILPCQKLHVPPVFMVKHIDIAGASKHTSSPTQGISDNLWRNCQECALLWTSSLMCKCYYATVHCWSFQPIGMISCRSHHKTAEWRTSNLDQWVEQCHVRPFTVKITSDDLLTSTTLLILLTHTDGHVKL